MRVWWKLLSLLFRAFFEYIRWLVPDVDCLRSGPGPCRPGSECPGQWRVDRTHFCEVQVQVVSGPDLGVGPGLDPDRAYFFSSTYKRT